MSRPNAATAQDSDGGNLSVDGREPTVVVNGVNPIFQGPQDMDGETVSVEPLRSDRGPREEVAGDVSTRLDGVPNIAPGPTTGSSSTRVSAQGFLMGPEVPRSDLEDRSSTRTQVTPGLRKSTPSFLSGVAKAVQALPAAVEGFVLGQSNTGSVAPDAEGYASAHSSSPDGMRRPPSEGQVPQTPLLDESTLQRLNILHSTAPHLYQSEPPPSAARPPSTPSSDLQAEVRRQVQEFMMVRDEETRMLKGRVEALMTENHVLRQEVQAQLYSGGSSFRTGNQGGFTGWFNRGIGSLIGGSSPPKPPSPQRALDFRPPLPPVLETPCAVGPKEGVPVASAKPVVPPPPPQAAASQSQARVERPLDGGTRLQRRLDEGPEVQQDPASRTLDFDAAVSGSFGGTRGQGSGLPATSVDPMEVVLSGMAQLQGVIADMANSPKEQHAKQEVIKPGVMKLPDLPQAGPESCLLFSDWLHASKPALSDISDTSEELWTAILSEAGAWYSRFLTLDPISRLTSCPSPSEAVSQYKWARVSRRIETMILAACPPSIREEISSARVTGLLQVVARLYVIYAPGGLSERELGLRHIQDPTSGTTLKDTIEQLRKWNRWCDRMKELGGSLPDCALRIKALDKIAKAVLQQHPDVAFRVNLTRAALQVDSNPDDQKVVQLHAQLLGELEAVSHRSGPKEADKPKDQGSAKVKGVEPADGSNSSPKAPKLGKPGPKSPPNPKSTGVAEGGSTAGVPCAFFSGQNGCKKGSDCKFVHNWGSFSAAEKSQRCRNCGSKGHRANECKAGSKGEEKAKHKSPPGNPKASASPKAAETPQGAQGFPSSAKDMSQQHIKSMLADAAQILQQAAPTVPAMPVGASPAVPISSPCSPPQQVSNPVSPQSNQATPVAQGVPVTLAALSAQIESLRALARDHEVRMIRFSAEVGKDTLDVDGDARALLDSGATHAVIPFADKLTNLDKVSVTLAGDSREEWYRTAGGTLVVPPVEGRTSESKRLQTILPLGALVQTLGCKVSWSRRKGLRVTHPVLGTLKTGVSSNTCPYIQEEQALKLIHELESERLREFEQNVQAMEAELQQMSAPRDPTEALRRYVKTGARGDLMQALFAQPYLKTIPEVIKVKLCEDLPGLDDKKGWDILKRLPVSRARRRTLLTSRQWVVSLCSGASNGTDPIKQWCQENSLEYVGVDVLERGGRGWDLTAEQGVWSVLLWAAATGRVTAVMSSPPYQTWKPTEDAKGTRTLDDPWGSCDMNCQVFKETLMTLQDMVLWSIFSVARGRAIPYLKEIPASQPGKRVGPGIRMSPEQFWDTKVWSSFENWARMKRIEFCQGSLGHHWLRPSILGTNLDMTHLQGLPRRGQPMPSQSGEDAEEMSKWCIGLKKEIVEVLSGKVKGPTVEALDKVIAAGLRSNSHSSSVVDNDDSSSRSTESDEVPREEADVCTPPPEGEQASVHSAQAR